MTQQEIAEIWLKRSFKLMIYASNHIKDENKYKRASHLSVLLARRANLLHRYHHLNFKPNYPNGGFNPNQNEMTNFKGEWIPPNKIIY